MFGLTARRLVFILFILAVIFLAREYFPPYYTRFEFGDSVRQTAKYAAAAQRNTEAVKREILSAAKESGVPITEDDIKIVTRGPIFTVDIDYTWPVDLKIYKHDLVFHISESGEMFEK